MPKGIYTRKKQDTIERFTISLPKEYVDILWEIGALLRKSGSMMAQEIVKKKCKEIKEAMTEGKEAIDVIEEFKNTSG